MKDFDADRRGRMLSEEDRTFALGGEVFVALPSVHPSTFEPYDQMTADSPIGETLRIVDEVILGIIDPRDGAHARYMDVRASREDAVSVTDLLDVVQWLMEVATGRPTGQPSGSSPGLARTGAPSTAAASSPAAPASTD